ncbi:serine/threonine-protein kinase Sgk2 [Blumeria hordei DH14]|uniref:Serine/threonine-protein kinase Sgk2 n=1 Tax=Blumeria graminis f. sp. hordei (strain DH14) TaxID=546991 RepID=N1JK49_BLUG1|nr:serine/threonine-protein kinase Sgk2 [Blumeria hordei DH14]
MPQSVEDSAHFAANPLLEITSNFMERCANSNIDISRRRLDEDTDLQPISTALSTLLMTLNYYAKYQLPPSAVCTYMPELINSIKRLLASGNISSRHFIPFINSILDDETDIDIWKQLKDLVDSLEPTSINIMDVRSTPLNDLRHIRCTAPFKCQNQLMESLKDELRTELTGKIIKNFDDFYKKYFEETTWANKCKDITKRYLNRRDKVSFQFPADPTETNVWAWIKAVQAKFIEPYKPYKTSKDQKPIPLRAQVFQSTGPRQINGGLAPQQIDVFLKRRQLPARNPHDWLNVLVIGELTTSPFGKWTDKFLQLSAYMRELFAAQPFRRFAKGFLMFGTQLQLWISWRAIGRKSEAEPLLKARHVRGLATLIGSKDICKINELRSGLSFTEGMKKEIHPPESKMTTACHSAKSGSLNSGGNTELNEGVKRGSESIYSSDKVILRKSKRACVVNISRQAQLNAATERIRRSVKLGDSVIKTEAKNKPKKSEANADPAVEVAASESSNAPDNLATHSSLDRIRDADDNGANTDVEISPERDMKKLCISGNTGESNLEASAGPVTTQENDVPGATYKEAVLNADMNPPGPDPNFTNVDTSTVYRNRQNTVIVLKPFGRAIDENTTPLELVCGLRDAIKGHKLLFMNSKILYRDISTNNILLTDPKLNDGCCGVLIDLDLAISLSDENYSADAKLLTGTMEFIALGILRAHVFPRSGGIFHSYRHDLESFFYVLILVCIRLGWPLKKSPFIRRLSKWYKDFEDIILDAFSPKFNCLKELASKLRIDLFQRYIDPCINTDLFPEDLYNSILKVSDEEIVKMKRELYSSIMLFTHHQKCKPLLTRRL